MTEEYLQVEENKDLIRDTHSKAIINTNRSAYESAISRAKAAQKQRDGLRDAVRDINNLKCEIHEIKNLLLQLVDKK